MKRLFFFATTALATLIPTLAMSMAAASRETVGVHDDWTTHILREGKLRLCYAETKLIPPKDVAHGLGDVRLQVTSRSLGTASDMYRLQTHPDSPDMDITVAIGSTRTVQLKSAKNAIGESNIDYFHAKLVEQMKAGETAKSEMELTRDRDGASLGTGSLRGFTEAYDDASKICSTNESGRRYGDRYKDPVTTSALSAVVEPSVYAEFSFTGPFFGKHENRVTVRAVPSGHRNIGSYLEPKPVPESIFRYGSDRLVFYKDGDQIHDGFGAYRTDVRGICFDPESERLRLLMDFWHGGASDPGQDVVFYFDPASGIVSESVSNIEGSPSLFDCSDAESVWADDGSFLPCLCAGKADNNEYRSRLENMVLELDRLSHRTSGAPFHNLLLDIGRLEPWVQWDALTTLDVKRFESSKFEVVVITYRDHTDVYRCNQITFVRRLPDEYFVPVYEAGVSSKAFNTLTIHGFVDTEVLDLTMCVDDCDWWGRHDRVTKNVGDWWQEAREEK